MRESLASLYRELDEAVRAAAAAAEEGSYAAAAEGCKRILSAGSKLHSRLTLMAELDQEARWVAEVDRAVHRANGTSVIPVHRDGPAPNLTAPKRGRKPRQTPSG